MRTMKRGAFSLMEVNLAILMVALGLLSLFSLFPAGLRESQSGLMDTQEAMFADHVFSTLEGNAQGMLDWNMWLHTSTFFSNVLDDCVYVEDESMLGVMNTAVFPLTTTDKIRYQLDITAMLGDHRRYRATLKVMSGQMGSFADHGVTYYTEFIYCGM